MLFANFYPDIKANKKFIKMCENINKSIKNLAD